MGRRYSRSPSPIGYRRRDRSSSPRDHHYRCRGRDLPSSLLVRNLRYDCRTEDLRGPFGEFGPLKDVYLPRDYYAGEFADIIMSRAMYYSDWSMYFNNCMELRGFGFVEYVDREDAAEAKYEMDGREYLLRKTERNLHR